MPCGYQQQSNMASRQLFRVQAPEYMVLETATLVRAKRRSVFHTVVFLKTEVF